MQYPYPITIAGDARAIYRHLRSKHPEMSAVRVLQWAHHDAKVDQLADRMDVIEEASHSYGSPGPGEPFMILKLDAIDPYGRSAYLDGADDRPLLEILAYVDDEPYDPGDCELTEDDWSNLQVIGLSARLAGEDVELQTKWSYMRDGEWTSSYGGVAFWGYGFDSRTSDAEREALSAAIEAGWLDLAKTEIEERDYWAARDVATVA